MELRLQSLLKSLVAVAASNEDRDVLYEYLAKQADADSWKPTTRVATTAALPAHTSSGNTLTASANGPLTVDTVADLVDGDTVLVLFDGAQNGPYVLTQGDASTPWSLTRASWFDVSSEAVRMVLIGVREGTANGGHWFALATEGPIVLGTTALEFLKTIGLDETLFGRAVEQRVLDPRDFGAKGDGVADDSAALVAWAQALSAATIDAPMRARARGTFLFSSELLFAPSSASGRIDFDLQGAAFKWTGPAGRSLTASLTFSAVNKTITRNDGGSFISQGWVEGRWIEISGTASNNKRVRIAQVAATVLTIESSQTLVDETVAGTLTDRMVWMQFGDSWNNKKLFRSRVSGLYLVRSGAAVNYQCAVKVQLSDFMLIENATLGATGTGSRNLDVVGILEGAGGTNGLTLINVETSGGDESAVIASNNFCWRGGKVQQHKRGPRIVSSASVEIAALDCSLITETGLQFETASSIKIQAYFEACGPATRGNDAKLIHMVGCNGVEIAGAHINGAFGAGVGTGTHPGYGIYLESCEGVDIRGCKTKICQRAILFCDAACRGIELGASMSKEDFSGADNNTFQPIQDDSGRLFNRAKGRAPTPLPAGLANLVEPDISQAAWSKLESAAINGTVPNEDGGGTAPVLELPDVTVPESAIECVSAMTSGVTTQTLYLRAKLRLVNFRVPDPADRTTDMAVIRMQITRSGNASHTSASPPMRIGPEWDWYEWRYVNPPADDTFVARIAVRQSQEPIDVAIETVELVQA